MLDFFSYSRRFAAPLWAWYAGGTVMLAAVNIINLEIPQLAKQAINMIAAPAPSGQGTATVTDLALAIMALGLIMVIVRALSRIIIFWPGRRIEASTKSWFFARVMDLPQAFFDKCGMGDLISRIANDIGQIRVFYAFGVLQILNVLFLLLFTIFKMAEVHLPLTLACLVPLVLMVAVMRFTMPKLQEYSRANQAALGTLTSRVTEAFVNVHVIQANAAAEAFALRADEQNDLVYETNMKMVAIRTLMFPMMLMLAGLSQLAVLFYGGHEVIAGRLTVGDILAFNVYIALLTFPLTAIGIIVGVWQRARTAFERLGEIDEAQPESAGTTVDGGQLDAAPMPHDAPLVEIRNLSFGFPGAKDGSNSPLRLDGVSFSVGARQRIGVCGPIGCGKTTLFNVITRLYCPDAGQVFFRSRDVAATDAAALRSHVGYVLQSVHLFSATIRENLSFGLAQPPDDAQLAEACRRAAVLDEILAMPGGFATEIGEKGVRLSGGQKQRLALARIFLRHYDLLILDDVLSAVDHVTEQHLIRELFAIDSALILASHRPAALRHCQQVLLMDQGRIIDRGTYDELALRQPGLLGAAAGTGAAT